MMSSRFSFIINSLYASSMVYDIFIKQSNFVYLRIHLHYSMGIRKWFRKPKPAQIIEEYIYLDENRLASYADQLKAPITTVQNPTISFEINALGPTLKAGYSGNIRSFTTYEKLDFIINHLGNSGQLVEERWSGNNHVGLFPFRMETCMACKLIVSDPESDSKIAIWISRTNPRNVSYTPKTLLLVEKEKGDDGQPDYRSGYSQLIFTVAKSTPAVLKIVMNDNVEEYKKNPLVFFNEKSAQVVQNPFAFFERLGADIFPERCIRTLYRVRDACYAEAPDTNPVAFTIGYPIFIADANPNLLKEGAAFYLNKPISGKLSEEEME